MKTFAKISLLLLASTAGTAANAQTPARAATRPPADAANANAQEAQQVGARAQAVQTTSGAGQTSTAAPQTATSSTATAPQTGAPAASAQAGAPVTVGGAPMYPNRTIVQNASNASNLTTLVKAVTAAGLGTTLSGPGPFTVFAPTNQAFGLLPAGVVDTLLKPENKPTLVKLLTYHVVPGAITSDQLKQQIQAGGGTATLKTVEGENLTASIVNGNIALTDVNGSKSYVETPDVRQSNGVVHVVNGVLVPKQ